MTLEELWELFPIVLTPQNPEWKAWAREEIAGLESILADFHPMISHIGSTAIESIWSKPTIDILVEIPAEYDTKKAARLMESNGYILMSATDERMSFIKGYTPQGYADKVYHIHFHNSGDNDEILFRDYLNNHPSVAREYDSLKKSLLPKYRHDRDGYTKAKSEFVRQIIELARTKR